MTLLNQLEAIKKAHDEYYTIGSVPCPAFGGEEIYFNNHGWNHILRRGSILRSIEERIRRVSLLIYAPKIISATCNIAVPTEIIKGESYAYFWAIFYKIEGRKIRIILRQLNGGKKHFFSIMEEGN